LPFVIELQKDGKENIALASIGRETFVGAEIDKTFS
jgi:hypothetical protein